MEGMTSNSIFMMFVAVVAFFWAGYALYKSSDYTFERRRHNQKTYGLIAFAALTYVVLSIRWVVFGSGSKIGSIDDISWNLNELLNYYIYYRFLHYSLKRNLEDEK